MTSRALRVGFATLTLSASVAACMQGPEETKTSSEAIQICLSDAAPCVDLPDAFSPPWSDAGFPSPPTFFDAAFPDAGNPFCNALDPKYYAEYMKAIGTLQLTPCFACTAGQCCYGGLACVAR